MENITQQLIILTVGAFCTASLSSLLEFCFQPTNIFQRYLPWLAAKLLKYDEEFQKALNSAPDFQTVWDMLNYRAGMEVAIYKPLGGCVVCMNVWLAFISFGFPYLLLDLHLIYFLPYVFMSNGFLRLILK